MENSLATASDNNAFVESVYNMIGEFLSSLGVPGEWLILTQFILMLVIIVVIVALLQMATNKILNFVFKKIHKITHLSFFKHAVKNRLPHYLALVIPYSFVSGAIPVLFFHFQNFISPSTKLLDIYMVFMIIWTVNSVVDSFINVLEEKPSFKGKPMKSYAQVIQIILYILGTVVIFCILTGKSPTIFFATMAGASAVMLLMFKDTIMGFVSSIQLSSNDMVRIGDWITMNKYGADGTVEEVNLTTVKVRNFDKTITTIPTYALISDSFQNWRGMQDSGGRRIKRAINIQQNSIRFLSDDELQKYMKIEGLDQYIKEKKDNYNENTDGLLANIDPGKSHILTNNDLFIRYAINYLRNHPQINQTMTLLVRQLAPTPDGLPIEVYTFTSTTIWADYEGIMSEIMNHFICAVSIFDLIVYEETAGTDILDIRMNRINNESSTNN